MKVSHINDTLAQVQRLRETILDKQLFRGFSGPARATSGTMAIFGAGIMVSSYYPQTIKAHLLGWGAVFLAASLINLGAVLYWFWNDDLVKRNFRRLRPALDVLPPLFVGAVLTCTFILAREFNFLFGVWMCMFGLTNLASRYVLPPLISMVGFFYIACGMACLLKPDLHFLNPLPMGLVFFTGEWISGLILYFDRRRYDAICHFLEGWEKNENE